MTHSNLPLLTQEQLTETMFLWASWQFFLIELESWLISLEAKFSSFKDIQATSHPSWLSKALNVDLKADLESRWSNFLGITLKNRPFGLTSITSFLWSWQSLIRLSRWQSFSSLYFIFTVDKPSKVSMILLWTLNIREFVGVLGRFFELESGMVWVDFADMYFYWVLC